MARVGMDFEIKTWVFVGWINAHSILFHQIKLCLNFFWGPRVTSKGVVKSFYKPISNFWLWGNIILENSPTTKLLFSLFHLVLEHSVHLYCSSINQTLQRTTSEFQNIFAALRISVAALWFRYSYSFKNSYCKLEIKPLVLGSRIWDVEAFWYKTEINFCRPQNLGRST